MYYAYTCTCTCSKLRAKLGLKPLDVGDHKQSSTSKDSGKTDGETNGEDQTTGNNVTIDVDFLV